MEWPEKWTPKLRIEWLSLIAHDLINSGVINGDEMQCKGLINSISFLPDHALQDRRGQIEPELSAVHERVMKYSASVLNSRPTPHLS